MKKKKNRKICIEIIDDILVEIIGFLSIQETLNLSLTSKRLHELCNANYVWKEKIRDKDFFLFVTDNYYNPITIQEFKKAYRLAIELKSIFMNPIKQMKIIELRCMIDVYITKPDIKYIRSYETPVIPWLRNFVLKYFQKSKTKLLSYDKPVKWIGFRVSVFPTVKHNEEKVYYACLTTLNCLIKFVKIMLPHLSNFYDEEQTAIDLLSTSIYKISPVRFV